jgi:predicted SprT family Zn-dependent metalloprotease
MDLKQAESLAHILMTRHGLDKHNFKLKWDNSKACFGKMDGHNRLIILSRRVVLLNHEDEVKETILHEIAHALDYVRSGFRYRHSNTGRSLGHDEVWKSICREIGCKAERCASVKDVVSPQREQKKWRLVHVATGKTIRTMKRRVAKYEIGQYLVDGVASQLVWRPL